MPQLSIVSTMYRSEQYISEFYARIMATLKKIGVTDYEFIFVDDGSPDNSLDKALSLRNDDDAVKVIELSRNFGHHKAIMTGLSHASGEHVFLIDLDLEEPPETLEEFWNELQNTQENDSDVVYGVQKSRKGGWFERISGGLFYKIFNALADNAKIPKNFLTIRLMKQKYVAELLKFKGANFIFAPICSLAGFKQKEIEVAKKSTSKTNYGFFKKYNLLIQAVMSYSTAPLYFIFYFGIITSFLSVLFGFSIILNKLLFGVDVDGWASLMVSIWFLGGCIICFLGITAIYISKIFVETRNHPFSIIRNIWE